MLVFEPVILQNLQETIISQPRSELNEIVLENVVHRKHTETVLFVVVDELGVSHEPFNTVGAEGVFDG